MRSEEVTGEAGRYGIGLAVAEVGLALGTVPVNGSFLKDDLDVSHIEAGLAEVVRRLSIAFDAIRPTFDLLEAIDEAAPADLEKRVALTFIRLLSQFAQFRFGSEKLLLELRHFGGMKEETLLGIQKLAVDVGQLRSDRVELLDPKHRVERLLCQMQGGCSRAD